MKSINSLFKTSSIFILIGLSACVGCKINDYSRVNKDMQPLDLNTIIAQINQLSISGNASIQKIQNKNSIIEFSALNNKKRLYYAVEDLKTGKIINVNGDPISGYRKESYYINDLILEIRTYYGDSKLRSVSHIHIDRLHENYVPLGY